MRIGWVSAAPMATTGYGGQTFEVCSRLLEHHEVTCMGQTGDVIVWGGRQKIETANGILYTLTLADPADQVINKSYMPHYHWDLIIGFMDAFGLEYLNNVDCPVIGWIPIDGPFTEMWKHHLRNYYKVFSYSYFGYEQLLDWFPPSKVGYIPHGIPDDFHPLRPEERDEVREELELTYGIPTEAMLIINVGANIGPRKELPLMMLTFSALVRKIKARGDEPPYLFMHTNAFQQFPRGYDLITWRRMVGMEQYIRFPTYNPIINPATNEQLNRYYNASDLYTQNSVAEGFGLPEYEALATGTSVVCPRNSAQIEIVKGRGPDRGWLVDCVPIEVYAQIPVYVPQLPTYPVPDQTKLLEAWEDAYYNRDKLERYGKAGVEYINNHHRWNTCMPKWLEGLREIDEELDIFDNIWEALSPTSQKTPI